MVVTQKARRARTPLGARLVELVTEGVGHAGGEPSAHAGGVGAQQQTVDALAEGRAARSSCAGLDAPG